MGEKQANGAAEEAGKTVREIMKVYKCAIEDGIKEALPDDAIILQWLARWSAMAYNRYQVGSDGKTAYQRQLGKPCREEVVSFGEKVLYKQLRRSGDKKNVMDIKWHEGIWLGHARATTEVLIGSPSGVVKAWSVKRLAPSSRWDAALIKGMQGTPKRPNPSMPGIDVPTRIIVRPNAPDSVVENGAPIRAEEATPRGVYLKKEDFESMGAQLAAKDVAD